MSGIIKEERIGGQRLILGDCVEVMAGLGVVDAVVTDPPYGIDPHGAGYGRSGRAILNDGNLDLMAAGVSAAFSLMPVGCAVVFYSARNTPSVMRVLPVEHYLGELIWDKKAPGMGKPLRYQHENIALFSKGGAKLAQTSFTVLRHYRMGEVHPHQKPDGLMWELVALAGGKLTLDPFMGSGTTLVACAKARRAGVGIELGPEYFDLACQRVDTAARAPDMFSAAAAPEQTGFEL